MQLKRRIKKLHTISETNFDEWLNKISDAELQTYAGKLSAKASKHDKALTEFIRSLPIEEVEAMRHQKYWLLSDETKRRLNHVNQIKN